MNNKWWNKEVIYQIYPKSFKDSNNDGIGDLEGIRQKLGYLKELGITALWICPFFKSPMADNGYDIADFKDVDKQFGTMQDFDKLLVECQTLGLKVILDLVINHTSDEHEWFVQALTDKNSKYRDYYIFKPGIGDLPPNNWRSIFGGSVWEKVDDEYYYHTFHKKQPDLNWENPQLRAEIYEMVNWWLAKGIAGFRIDSITFIKKDQSYQSLAPDGADNLASCKYLTRNQPGIEVFLNELKEKTFAKFDAVTIGEAPGVEYQDYDKFIGPEGYFSMIFDFHYVDLDVQSGVEWFKKTNWQVQDLQKLIAKSQMSMKDVGWAANFLENHDQPRSVSKLIKDPEFQSADGAKTLALLFFFLKGVPFIYQGQELGMKNFVRQSIDEFNDISSIDNYQRSIMEGFSETEALKFVNDRSRDNSRTPFPWNSEQYGGFSDKKPWLAMTEEFPKVNAASNQVLDFYKQMIAIRQKGQYSDCLIYGDIEFITSVDKNVIAYKRIWKNQTVIVYLNLGVNPVKVATKGIKKIILTTTNWDNTKTISLSGYQGIVFEECEINETA